MAKKLVPIHFLKVIDFERIDKPNTMFMQLLLSGIFEKSPDAETVDSVFRTGFLMTHAEKEEGVEKFIRGFSGFVLGKFYLRIKRQNDGNVPKALSSKLKAAFAVIQDKQGVVI